jgi:hypothetical protein
MSIHNDIERGVFRMMSALSSIIFVGSATWLVKLIVDRQFLFALLSGLLAIIMVTISGYSARAYSGALVEYRKTARPFLPTKSDLKKVAIVVIFIMVCVMLSVIRKRRFLMTDNCPYRKPNRQCCKNGLQERGVPRIRNSFQLAGVAGLAGR